MNLYFDANNKLVFDPSLKVMTGGVFERKILDYLIIGAGGAGGSGYSTTLSSAGGGGAGGYIYHTGIELTGSTYDVIVGSGISFENGENSSFNGYTAIGGGHGSMYTSAPDSGGCGGGGCGFGVMTAGTGSQGFNGGDGSNPSGLPHGGGGGGIGTSGETATVSTRGSNGGDGLSFNITGTPTYYGGGGGGGGWSGTPGYGGLGGGGGSSEDTIGGAGAANTGGGGGGSNFGNSAVGGSGVVIVRYKTSNFPSATGGTSTTSGSYTIRTFTSNGTLTIE